jgi:hypothetical protein
MLEVVQQIWPVFVIMGLLIIALILPDRKQK